MESHRILIADDQAPIVEALQLLLKTEGFVTETVNSPAAVLEAIQGGNFDLLLLDMNYARDTTSGNEGLELLARIREVDTAVPVVFMTAWGTIDLAVEAMRDGGRDFVQKPWDNAKLLGSLRRQIEEGRVLREKKQEIAEAREIQRRLLPDEIPEISGCDIQAFWKPAKDVGGDYFDAIRLTDDMAAFCIADVAGKGVPAALLMCTMQASVRGFAHETFNPATICRNLNRVALENTRSERFTTFFYGVLDSTRRSLCYCNAGHVPPILIRQDGTIKRLSEGGTILGVFPDVQYEQSQTAFASGDRLVLITDGITEAMNDQNEEFGEDRLIDLLLQYRHMGAAELHKTVIDADASFARQALQDDATLMIVAMH